MNAAGSARKKWKARTLTKFTKPGDRLLVEPFICTEYNLKVLNKFFLDINMKVTRVRMEPATLLEFSGKVIKS